jgi:hypothetical protein
LNTQTKVAAVKATYICTALSFIKPPSTQTTFRQKRRKKVFI